VVLFAWNGKLSVGVGAIDKEHRALFDSVNTMQSALDGHEDRSTITILLHNLDEDTRAHFKSEEAMMTDNGYPGTTLHAMKHQHLLDQLKAFLMRFDRGAEINEHSLNFLRDWLVSHVQEVDKYFGLWLNEHGKS
jgi:hemerythrin-like metal-binding protein